MPNLPDTSDNNVFVTNLLPGSYVYPQEAILFNIDRFYNRVWCHLT